MDRYSSYIDPQQVQRVMAILHQELPVRLSATAIGREISVDASTVEVLIRSQIVTSHASPARVAHLISSAKRVNYDITDGGRTRRQPS
jgi:hypothetical protein